MVQWDDGTAGGLVGYARVSTSGQDLTTQVRALTRHGVPEDRVYAEHVTGTRPNRPELDNCLRALRPGDRLVVTKLDRLARSLKDLLTIVDRVENAGAGLVVLDQAVDTTTPAGRLFLHVVGAVAEFEAALISERTKAALAGRGRGRHGGRPVTVTPAKGERVLELLASGVTRAEAARAISVGESTLYRWLAARDDVPPGQVSRSGGRPPSLSVKGAARAVELGQAGMTVEEAAGAVGVSASTLKRARRAGRL